MLGLCCQYLEPVQKKNGQVLYKNSIEEKTLQLGAYKSGKYSFERLVSTYHHNVDQHIKLVDKLVNDKIHVFRLSSNLFPLWEFNSHIIKNDESLLIKLKTLGRAFLNNNIRVTCHPGQFTVISSDNPNVIENSIRELEYHAFVFDQMGLPQNAYAAINIHGGKADRSETIINVYSGLPSNIRKRLTLENDEKCYNVSQLLEISARINVPITLDSHHYTFSEDDVDLATAISETKKTWRDIKPIQHVSNTEPGFENGSFNERRAHSQYIHNIPELQLNEIANDWIDVDVEAKAKNLAIYKLRKQLHISL